MIYGESLRQVMERIELSKKYLENDMKKKTLMDYEDVIKSLPLKEKYTKEELLTKNFLMDKEGNIEIYYSPHNEYINRKAKIFIVGLTPGFQQMNASMKEARMMLEYGHDIEEIKYRCKKAGRFCGEMRKNIISMLNELELYKNLGIADCRSLFEEDDNILHTTSLIKYPVFINGKNYTGHSPKLLKSAFLMDYARENFRSNIEELLKGDKVLIIPLGMATEEAVIKMVHEGAADEGMVLKGFPHPSGANGHRRLQFEKNKNAMESFLSHFNFY